MSERFKELVLKTSDTATYRGFESHSLRQKEIPSLVGGISFWLGKIIEEEIYLNQKKYYDSIAQCHINGNANSFIDFMLESIDSSLEKITQKTTQKIKLNNNQLKIIEYIKENPRITRNELADKLNITPDGVKYNLKKLINNDIIERIGPDNGGYWSVK